MVDRFLVTSSKVYIIVTRFEKAYLIGATSVRGIFALNRIIFPATDRADLIAP